MAAWHEVLREFIPADRREMVAAAARWHDTTPFLPRQLRGIPDGFEPEWCGLLAGLEIPHMVARLIPPDLLTGEQFAVVVRAERQWRETDGSRARS